MIIEKFLEKFLTYWIPLIFGYLLIPFRYVFLFIIDRPLTFCLISIISLFFGFGFFLSNKFFERVEEHISILYIDLIIIILSITTLVLSAIGLNIKY